MEEGQRQMILLAIGRLAVERPGWDWALGEIAHTLQGREMFEQFKALKRGEETGIVKQPNPPAIRPECPDKRIRELIELHGKSGEEIPTREGQLVFADTVLALGELARYRNTDDELMRQIGHART